MSDATVRIDRARLHKALDAFLDEVEKRPLSVDDGEQYVFKLEGGRVGSYDDEEIVGFMLTTSRTETI